MTIQVPIGGSVEVRIDDPLLLRQFDAGISAEHAELLIRENLVRSCGVAEEKLRQLEGPWTARECEQAAVVNSFTASAMKAFTAQEIGRSVGKMMDNMIVATLKGPMNIREHVEAWNEMGLIPAIVDDKRHGLIYWNGESRSCAFYVEDPVVVPGGLSILSESVGKWRVRTVALDETPMLAQYWAIERAAIVQEFPNTGTCLIEPRRKS